MLSLHPSLLQVAHSLMQRRLSCTLRAWQQVARLSADLRAIGSLAVSRHMARTAQQVGMLPISWD